MTGTNCDLFTHKSVPVIFEPPCTSVFFFFSLCEGVKVLAYAHSVWYVLYDAGNKSHFPIVLVCV